MRATTSPLAHDSGHTIGDVDEQGVAEVVTETVVHEREAVEVDEQHADRVPGGLGAARRLVGAAGGASAGWDGR